MSDRSKNRIRVGIGGWTFAPWRGSFYPDDLPQKSELEYASRQMTSIEVNGTYYSYQKPETFAKWRDETPDDFIFSLKAPRFATNRRVLAEAGPSIDRFMNSGVSELHHKLGPVNWQLQPGKVYNPDDFEAFLRLLPQELKGRPVRHAVEVRHESFKTPEFIDQLRKYRVAAVFTDKEGVPNLRDITAPFVYVRLHRSSEAHPDGYPATELEAWANRARQWASGRAPTDGESIASHKAPRASSRDVFIYAINGFKPKAPHAAMALLQCLG